MTEGIGIARLTANFGAVAGGGVIDRAIKGNDQDAIWMMHWLLRCAPRQAARCLGSGGLTRPTPVQGGGAVRGTLCGTERRGRGHGRGGAARGYHRRDGACRRQQLRVAALTPRPPEQVLCDGGDRYRSKVFDTEWLAGRGLTAQVPADFVETLVRHGRALVAEPSTSPQAGEA